MDVQQVPSATGRVTVAPAGQIDLATAPKLAAALAEARRDGISEIVVDLAEVDFLDSAGVRVLVQASRETTAAGATLYLKGAEGWVARVLEITGVAEFLPPPPESSPASTD